MPAERERKQVGRPRSFKEDEALEQVTRVFWEKGFEGASMADLVAATGMKPASLYAAFGNKQSLFRRALDRYLSEHLAFIRQALEQPTAFKVAETILLRTVDFLARPNHPRGCLTLQTLSCGEEARPVHDCLAGLRRDSLKALRLRFQRARRDGDLPPQADPDGLARFVTAVMQGMSVQAIDGASRKELLAIANTALRGWPTDGVF